MVSPDHTIKNVTNNGDKVLWNMGIKCKSYGIITSNIKAHSSSNL